MGLNCSHDAFDGAYSSFNRLRQAICFALGEGASFPPHCSSVASLDPNKFYVPDELPEKHQGLWEFLSHSDCDGEISPEMCSKVADDLEWLLPTMRGIDWIEWGHIEREGGYVKVIEKFINGCRKAAARNEPLLFR